MTADANTATGETGGPAHSSQSTARPRLRQFPAVVAIGIYMYLLGGACGYYAITRRVGLLYLPVSVLFVVGASGLMTFRRWGWALTLAAVALMSGFYFWSFSMQHAGPSLMQGLLDLVFVLYLIRSELREKMR